MSSSFFQTVVSKLNCTSYFKEKAPTESKGVILSMELNQIDFGVQALIVKAN